MSLERHGSLRRFWVGRLFRIYPAFLAAAALMGVLIASGVLTLTAPLQKESAGGALAHVTMLCDLVGVRGIVRVFWTLSYEMTFYLIVAGLFVYGLHRRSTWWASGLAATALLAGPLLPDALLTPGFQSRRLVAAALVVLVAGSIAAYLSGRRAAVLAAGAVGIGFVLLPALNGSSSEVATIISSWQALLMLAVMFAGTVIYHAQYGLVGRRAAGLTLAGVTVCVIGAHWIHLRGEVNSAAGLATMRGMWIGTTLAVVATFAVGFVLRRRPVPRLLAWFGTISYSVYLLHAIALLVFLKVLPAAYERALPARVGIGVLFVAVVLAMSWVSYRLVERPAQLLGRRFGAWLDARWGLPATPAPATPAPATPAPATPGSASFGTAPATVGLVRSAPVVPAPAGPVGPGVAAHPVDDYSEVPERH
jgi:peptidoglycan/LPS O-acetylase OafA/YrhL